MERAGVEDENELKKARQIFLAKENFIKNAEFRVDLYKPHY
jgi:hypothetical protein